MSAAVGKGQLTMATRQLNERWAETRKAWRDGKAADFEQAYLSELNDAVNGALSTLDELDKILGKIHADCE